MLQVMHVSSIYKQNAVHCFKNYQEKQHLNKEFFSHLSSFNLFLDCHLKRHLRLHSSVPTLTHVVIRPPLSDWYWMRATTDAWPLTFLMLRRELENLRSEWDSFNQKALSLLQPRDVKKWAATFHKSNHIKCTSCRWGVTTRQNMVLSTNHRIILCLKKVHERDNTCSCIVFHADLITWESTKTQIKK